MNIKFLAACAGAAILGLSTAAIAQSGSAMTAAPAAPSGTASFCGVVVKLHASECIAVKSNDAAGTLYEITSAHNRPLQGQMISGTGATGDTSTCTSGTHLSRVSWHPVSSCPMAAGATP